MPEVAHEPQRSGPGGSGPAMPFPRILCVDDDIRLLEGLQRVLQVDYDVVVESNPLAALRLLEHEPNFQVVLCDMKMPRLDGTQFLIRTRQILPAATRVLLTGVGNLAALVTAVNEGGVFRFLTKPCPREQLLAAIRAAVDQHRRTPGAHLGAPVPASAVIAPVQTGIALVPAPVGQSLLTPARGAAGPEPPVAPLPVAVLAPARGGARQPGSLRAVFTRAAEEALAQHRAAEAERLLAGPLQMLLQQAQAGLATSRDDTEFAAVLAARLAVASGNGAWLDYVFRLYVALQRLLPSHAVDELYAALHQTRGANPDALDLYVSVLELQARNFDALERCLIRRIQRCRSLFQC